MHYYSAIVFLSYIQRQLVTREHGTTTVSYHQCSWLYDGQTDLQQEGKQFARN